MSTAPSGEQWEIGWGGQRATIVEVGGGVRTFTDGQRDVLEPYPEDGICDGAHGTPLIPWPNRLADGKYTFDGADHQVPLTEPARHNAIHGFLRWQPWAAVRHESDQVVVGTRIHPRPGYPFDLQVQIEYRLSDAGLSVATTATNVGAARCPYASGQHPYLSPGSTTIDQCLLTLGADSRITTDSDRLLPTGTENVAGSGYDFRDGRKLGDTAVDSAFTDLARDDEGRSWTRLSAPDGRTVEMWQDESYPYTEIFTGDSLSPSRRRQGLGVEPMTAPPNAFATGTDLVVLTTGESNTARWGVRLR